MGYFDSRDDPRSRPAAPSVTEDVVTRCPSCRSASIVTTAKKPNADSYWRCQSCGELWNSARRNARRGGSGGWR